MKIYLEGLKHNKRYEILVMEIINPYLLCSLSEELNSVNDDVRRTNMKLIKAELSQTQTAAYFWLNKCANNTLLW